MNPALSQTAAAAARGDSATVAADNALSGSKNWGEWLEDCQSFLASTAVHLVALIVLGLCVASVDRRPEVHRVEVQLGTGNDAVLGEEGLMAGDLDANAIDEHPVAPSPSDKSSAASKAAAVTPPLDSSLGPAAVESPGDTAVADDLSRAVESLSGLGGTGLGDSGDGKDPWSGNGSPWGRENAGAEFFGIGGRGGSFVYVVDASGSMNEEGKYERARAELIRSIEALKENQRYYIIFYNDGWYPMDADHPVKATKRQIDRTKRWVSRVWPGGGTFPLEGLLHALSLEPDAIYFLSDGRFDPAVVDTLREKNPKRYGQVPIHTIAFVNRETIPLMKTIAKQSGGQFRFVQ